MSMRFLIYGHGGCYNHGGEALVRCGIEILRKYYSDCYIIVSSHNPEQDKEFGLDADEIVGRDESYIKNEKITNYSIDNNDNIYRSTIDKITPDTVCIHLGGDNYCYDNWKRYANIHYRALEKGAKSVFWSCSVDPKLIDKEMLDALKSHHLIAAREKITYDALKRLNIENVIKVSDMAFLLKPEQVTLPLNNYVSLTFGPLALRKERISGIVMQNFRNLADFILSETDMNIMLVPHVICPTDNDLETMSRLTISDANRVKLCTERYSAAQLKHVIGNARFCVTLRTHASIAAYSSCVPTLVMGYSSKSQGIAQDLGVSDYVLPVMDLKEEYDLVKKFRSLLQNESSIRQNLMQIMPDYSKSAIHQEMLQF